MKGNILLVPRTSLPGPASAFYVLQSKPKVFSIVNTVITAPKSAERPAFPGVSKRKIRNVGHKNQTQAQRAGIPEAMWHHGKKLEAKVLGVSAPAPALGMTLAERASLVSASSVKWGHHPPQRFLRPSEWGIACLWGPCMHSLNTYLLGVCYVLSDQNNSFHLILTQNS